MPTYDYVCDKCAHAFEHFQGISEPLLRVCPECGKRALRRLIGAGAGVMFKGSGFYETDYKRKSGSPDKPPATVDGKADAGTSADKPRNGGGPADGSSGQGGKGGKGGEAGQADKAGKSGKSDRDDRASPAGTAPGTEKSGAPARTGASGKADPAGKPAEGKPSSSGSGDQAGKSPAPPRSDAPRRDPGSRGKSA